MKLYLQTLFQVLKEEPAKLLYFVGFFISCCVSPFVFNGDFLDTLLIFLKLVLVTQFFFAPALLISTYFCLRSTLKEFKDLDIEEEDDE